MYKSNKHRIAVVIPTLNEEKGIGPTLDEIRQELKDLVVNGNNTDMTYFVVDSNSTDRTVEIAKQKGAEIIQTTRAGKGAAISEALEHINSDTLYILFTDADFTYPAEYIRPMIRILENDQKIGMVTGNRFNSFFEMKKLTMHNVNYLGNRFLAFVHYIVNGAKLTDPLTGLRIVRWDALKGWRPSSKGFDIEVEMNHLVAKRGYAVVEIPIKYRRRLGNKKLRWRHGFIILKRILSQ